MSEEDSFTYFNKNNGDVVTFPRRNSRLESYQNWVTVEGAEHLAELQASRDDTRSARGNLLGSSNVGDRIEPRHQVDLPDRLSTDPQDPDPKVDDPQIPADPDPTPVDPEVVKPPVEPDPTPSPDPGLDPADRPARSATRSAWVDWAVKAGSSREEAEAMTKSDLIEVYGK